jgi:hypothetical protein
VDLPQLQRWIDAYVDAWASNDPTQIGALFAQDARYYTHPYRPPWRGRDEIVKGWTEHPDPPNSWDCRYEALAVEGSTGVVRGETTYYTDDGSVRTKYANIFVVEFDAEGRATEFTEFFMRSDPSPRPA